MSRREIKPKTATKLVNKETPQMNAHSTRARGRKGLLGALLACAALLLAASAPAPAQAEFALSDFDITLTGADGSPDMQAGAHPFALTGDLGIEYTVGGIDPLFGVPESFISGNPRDLNIGLIPGMVADTTAYPRCSMVDFNTPSTGTTGVSCSNDTAVGNVAVSIGFPFEWVAHPVYSLEPPPGVLFRFGFAIIGKVRVVLDAKLNDAPPYQGITALTNASTILTLFRSKIQLWGNPSDPAHDKFRGSCFASADGAYFSDDPFDEKGFPGFKPGSKACPVEPRGPLLTLPTSCRGPQVTSYEARSWQEPGNLTSGSAITHDNATPPNPQGFSGCGKLAFSPTVSTKPTTASAETGSGIDFNLDFDDEGLKNAAGLAQSHVKKAVVTLPEGMTINPSIGEGLGVCTPADLDRETLQSAPGEGCPNASKIGVVGAQSPLLADSLEGSVFLAQQDDPSTATPGAENPFDTLIAFYIVIKKPDKGVLVKLPAKVEPDPNTGRLVVTLDDSPQVPISHFNLHFREGQRAALVSPPACGTYTTESKFYPWSDPTNPSTVLSDFQVTSGIGGGPCPPGGIPPFHPGFEAGSINNNAGSFSPFNMKLLRADGEQDMTKFSSILPPGELGSLAGVSKCPDSAIGIARAKTGREEIASPSCPANSLIGHTLAGAGVGSALTYVKGQIYLGGPYNGDPLSVISVTPALAGPFDAGTVVVRLALDLNPKTAEVEVDGANSDPIPHILKGIVLKVRDLRVYVDRPNFTLNPTSCDESSARATLFGSYLDVFNPADDVPVALSSRYQAANCLNLGFKPKLALNLKGGTRRGGHPGLVANYQPRRGDANVEGLVVRLPRSAFLDQAHIKTICTRVQFAADACPKNAQYGYIKAWTPLLDEPLQGPVWLRSSNHKLPDLIFDLHGLVDVEVATRIDSAHGGIRATVEDSPDAPLSKVLLRMQGGKKGLIVNSRNLCGHKSKANVLFSGHNGKQFNSDPVMRAECGGKRKAK
jgi:hypothetical protein